MGLSEDFWDLLRNNPNNDKVYRKAFNLVTDAPDGPERDGLLSLLYYYGMGVTQDREKAFCLASRAADHEEGIALYILGTMWENGEVPGRQCDMNTAKQLMTRCAACDSSWAEDARQWLDRCTDSGHGNNAGELADFYYQRAKLNGFANDEDNRKALQWVAEAANSNPYDYSYRYGLMLVRGIGCNPSFRLGVKYLEDAYDFGHCEAADALNVTYREQAEKEPDADRRQYCLRSAARWHERAEKLRAQNIKKSNQ